MSVESTVVRSPYPGLRPFDSSEAAIFFGREIHVERLLKILVQERFLAVIGPSGCGKSSLVRAGMLPAVMAGWAGTATEWRVATMRPGDHPLRSLARALIEPAVLGAELAFVDGSTATPPLVPMIESELARGPSGLRSIVAAARANANHSGAQPFHLLLLVDQFEEIFRYSGENEHQADEDDAFVKLLLESTRDDRAAIHVAMTMRSDFLGHCVRFLELPDAINRGQYLTPRLDRSQLTSAIIEPGRVFGGAVDAALANELVNTMGADQDQLPILQHALARMWELAVQRDNVAPLVTLDDLKSIDGIAGALSRHADSLFEALSVSDRHLAEVLLRAITERSTGNGSARDVRRPQTLSDVARISGLDWQTFVPVVESFAADGVNFIVCSSPIGADMVVDISHEALIRQWARLRQWVDDEDRQARELALWRQRSMDHAAGGELLAGNDLMRAVEWKDGLNATIHLSAPSNDGPEVPLRSAVAWASRYAVAAGPGSSFEEIVAFIVNSEKKEQAEIDARKTAEGLSVEREQQRLEAEKAAAEAKAETERARADAARREKELAEHHVGKLKTQRRLAWAIAVFAIATSVLAIVASRAADDAAREAAAQRDLAIKAGRAADDERVRATLALVNLKQAQGELQLLREQQATLDYRDRASRALPTTAVTTTAAVTTMAASTRPLPTNPTVAASGHLMDDAALTVIAPGLSADRRAEILSAMLPAMREFGIDTPLRQAAFVAQMAHESAGFRITVENLNYSANLLKVIWPTKFGDNDRAMDYAKQPEKIANYVYADRFGNGPEESGDGWRYRGRGPLSITGRDSYRRFGMALGVDLENEPDRAAEWSLGFRIAGVRWTTIKGNDLADQGDFKKITKGINGGYIGLDARLEWYKRTKKALGIE